MIPIITVFNQKNMSHTLSIKSYQMGRNLADRWSLKHWTLCHGRIYKWWNGNQCSLQWCHILNTFVAPNNPCMRWLGHKWLSEEPPFHEQTQLVQKINLLAIVVTCSLRRNCKSKATTGLMSTLNLGKYISLTSTLTSF